MNTINNNKATNFSDLKSWKILIPMVLGLVTVAFMFKDDFDYNAFINTPYSKYAFIWFLCAFLMMFLRDFGYVIRIRYLSQNQLTWMQSLRIIMLWEFTSAVTPSAVGGTSFAVLYVYKENISIGRSTAMVLLTSFLDEMYFIIMFPIIILSVNFDVLFSISQNSELSTWSTNLIYVALLGYSLKLAYILFISYGIFFNPLMFKKILFKLFSIKFLRKWRKNVVKIGIDIYYASNEFKNKSFMFWIKSFGATFLSWTARYWVVNFLFLAYFVVDEHFVIFARQLVMWIMMLVSPTPGGSGFTEFLFSEYLGEFIPIVTLIPVLAILWRTVTYYPYLIIGAFLLPAWLKKKF